MHHLVCDPRPFIILVRHPYFAAAQTMGFGKHNDAALVKVILLSAVPTNLFYPAASLFNWHQIERRHAKVYETELGS